MGDDFENEFVQQKIYEEKQKAKEEGLADPYTYTDPDDGSVFEWDEKRGAWFPKVDDAFLAKYHANYGSHKLCVPEEGSETVGTSPIFPKPVAPGSTTRAAKKPRRPLLRPGEKRKVDDPVWFDVNETQNRNVYVSGLPPDFTQEQFQQLMSKYGIIMEDADTLQPKMKLYQDSEGNFKGDGRCCFLKVESVDLAIQLLDGSELSGSQVHVERAQFQQKGQYDPSLKPKAKQKKKKKSKQKQKDKHHQERLLDWRPEKKGENLTRKDKVIILRNMFHPEEFEDDATMITEITDDIKLECEKFGEVKKVTIFDRHPDGVCSVAFKEFDSSMSCVEKMNGRWFASRQILAERWDGVTNYLIEETDREREERLKNWEKFIGDDVAKNTTDTTDKTEKTTDPSPTQPDTEKQTDIPSESEHDPTNDTTSDVDSTTNTDKSTDA